MTLLPPNASQVERALEGVTLRVGAINAPIEDMLNPATCPYAFLPWLGWALSVDDWSADWPEERQRAVIGASIAVHRAKGTVASIKRALVAAGYGTARLIEAHSYPRIGADAPIGSGSWRVGISGGTWADYEVEITQAVDRTEADRLAARLADVAPARCRLRRIYLSGVKHAIGKGIWVLGQSVPIGGVYQYEVA